MYRPVNKFVRLNVEPKTRWNQHIKAPEVRVVRENGEHLGVMKTAEAIALAQERELDLVEVNPKASPPVCRITAYDKYRYQQEKLERKAKKQVKEITVKGIRLSIRTSNHDLETKAKRAMEFFEDGDKVKVDVVMRGREQAHLDVAHEMIKRFLIKITVPYITEVEPKKVGNMLTTTIALGK
jgi:translation initiation factor IF-3